MIPIRTLIASVATAALLPVAAFAQTDLIFNSYLPPYDPLYQVAVKDFAARIEAESGGEITVTIPATSFAPSDRQYETVIDGIADMAIVPSGTMPQQVKLFRIADLPLHSPTGEDASRALWETYQEHLEPYEEFKGLKVLATAVLPGRQLMMLGDLNVEEPADLNGVKLWTPPGALMATAGALGSVPINTEFTALQEYVTKGNVDAMIMTPGSARAARVLEYTTGMTEVPGGLGSISFAVTISEARWAELSADEQAAILRAAEGLSARTGAAFDALEASAASEEPFDGPMVAEGEKLAAFSDILTAQAEEWKEVAIEQGIENPDEIVSFYQSHLTASN